MKKEEIIYFMKNYFGLEKKEVKKLSEMLYIKENDLYIFAKSFGKFKNSYIFDQINTYQISLNQNAINVLIRFCERNSVNIYFKN